MSATEPSMRDGTTEAKPPFPRSRLVNSLDSALTDLEACWQRGETPNIDAIWSRCDLKRNPSNLVALVKHDLRLRYGRGEFPSVSEYLACHSVLQAERHWVVSLVYEEFCLREECTRAAGGPALDPEEFCNRYPEWRDSLLSQLRYHRVISQAVSRSRITPRLPEIGDTFLGCQIVELLGTGGAAWVYRAIELGVGNRPVVLKVATDQGKEQDVLGKLEHPHIVPILWAVPRNPETGLRVLCMPYRLGVTLDRVLPEILKTTDLRGAARLWVAFQRCLPDSADPPESPPWKDFPLRGSYADAIAWLGLKLAQALDHAHGIPIVHRDLKPANVLLTVTDGPKLLDFNLAHDPASPEAAETAMRGGTLPYMAPEQLMAFLDDHRWKQVGPRADLFSLGLLLRELLTGQPPDAPPPNLTRSRALADMLDRRLRPLPPIHALAPNVPHALVAILDQCTASHTSRRYGSARELMEDLTRYLERRPLKHVRNPSWRERAWNLAARRGKAASLVMAVALTLGFSLGLHHPLEAVLVHRFLPVTALQRSLLPLTERLDSQGQPTQQALEQAAGDLRRLVLAQPRSRFAREILDTLTGMANAPSLALDQPLPPPSADDLDRQVPPDPLLARAFLDHGISHVSEFRKNGSKNQSALINKALTACKIALAFDPANAEILYTMGQAHQLADHLPDSRDALSKAIEILTLDRTESRLPMLIDCLRSRAVVVMHWSDRIRDQGGKRSETDRLNDMHRCALKDITEAGRLVQELDRGIKRRPEYQDLLVKLRFMRGKVLFHMAQDEARAGLLGMAVYRDLTALEATEQSFVVRPSDSNFGDPPPSESIDHPSRLLWRDILVQLQEHWTAYLAPSRQAQEGDVSLDEGLRQRVQHLLLEQPLAARP